MNKTISETEQYAQEFLQLKKNTERIDLVICPPFTGLAKLRAVCKEQINLGGQNMFWENSGAYTGEISADMLLSCGCRYVIVGHSERRRLFNESNSIVNRKMKIALEKRLIPVLCVGETLQERENKLAYDIVSEQLREGLAGLEPPGHSWAVAYEPVWAIGTGENAYPDDAQVMAAFIRAELGTFNKSLPSYTRILYGGSVTENNAAAFFAQADIDGALIGGASLNAETFANIAGKYKTDD
jgi:triosephosphate isomerase